MVLIVLDFLEIHLMLEDPIQYYYFWQELQIMLEKNSIEFTLLSLIISLINIVNDPL